MGGSKGRGRGWKGSEGKWWPEEDKGRGKSSKDNRNDRNDGRKAPAAEWVPKDHGKEKSSWSKGKGKGTERSEVQDADPPRSQLSSSAPDFQPGLYDFQSFGVPPPPPPPWLQPELPQLWQEFADAEGTKYFYNAKTGLSQWERPAELDPQRPEPPPKPRRVDHEPDPKKPPERNERNERKNEGTKEHEKGSESKGDGKGKKRRKAQLAEKDKEPSFGPPGCNLFVFHLPDDWTDEDLLEYFAPHGNVVSAKVMKELGTGRSRGFGFVSYEDRVSAATAIKKMQGFKILGKRLKVEFKKGEGDNGKDEKLEQEDKGNADDERLIGYLRAISAKSVVQSLKESEKEEKLLEDAEPED